MTVVVNGAALVRADEVLPVQVRGRQDEWAALSPAEQRLLSPEVLARWTADLHDDDYTLAELATCERRRLEALKTLRSGAELTDREWQLLRFLQQNEGRNVSYLRIARHLWSTPEHPVTVQMLRTQMDVQRPWYSAGMITTIQVIMHHIRRKLEIDPLRPQHLCTIRGVGYRYYAQPPSLDDGENYERRATEIERDRAEMQRVLGLVEGEYTAITAVDRDGNPYETSVWFGPEHPEARVKPQALDAGGPPSGRSPKTETEP